MNRRGVEPGEGFSQMLMSRERVLTCGVVALDSRTRSSWSAAQVPQVPQVLLGACGRKVGGHSYLFYCFFQVGTGSPNGSKCSLILVSYCSCNRGPQTNGLKQYKPVTFYSRRSEVLKSRCCQGYITLGGFRRESVPLCFSAPGGHLQSLAHGPSFLYLQFHDHISSD